MREYAGGYDDYLAQHKVAAPAVFRTSKGGKSKRPKASSDKPQKLTYKEQKLLEALPEQIAELEREQAQFQNQLNDPEFFKRPWQETQQVAQRLETLEAELLEAYAQWEKLDGQKA